MDSSANPTSPRPSRRRALVITSLVGLALAGAGWYGWQQWHAGGSAARGPGGPGGPGARAMAVVALPAMAGSMDVRVSALGTVTARNTATVRVQVSGRLEKLYFTEGQPVKAGQVLAQIDPRSFRVAVDSAKAQLAKDKALLAAAEVDLARYRTLLQQDSIAAQQVDTQAAQVAQYKAALDVDQAAVAQAELQLSYTHVTAPISGRAGLKQVDIGNLVQTSDANGLVVITEVQPISVVFAIAQQQLPAVLARLGQGAKLPVQAWDAQNRKLLATGTVASVDNQIDTATGTVKLKAEFQNRDNALFPNQFVNVQLVVDTLAQAVLVPASAIQPGASGAYVYVVKDDDTVTMRKVQVGPGDGVHTSVAQGIAVGERVVVDGVDHLREGAKVIVSSQRETPVAPAGGGRRHRPDGAQAPGAGAGAAPGPRGADAANGASGPGAQRGADTANGQPDADGATRPRHRRGDASGAPAADGSAAQTPAKAAP